MCLMQHIRGGGRRKLLRVIPPAGGMQLLNLMHLHHFIFLISVG